MNLRRNLDYLFVMTVLLLMSGAFISHLVDLSNASAFSEGSGTMQVIWFTTYLITLVRIVQHWRAVVAILRANAALTALATLSILSLVWSADPSATLRHSIAFGFSTLFGIDFARRYTLREQVGLITATLWFAILVSCTVQLVYPSFVLPATFGDTDIVDADAWIGVYAQKNIFGHVLAMAGVLAASQITWGRKRLLRSAAALVLCCIIVEKAKSQTALVVIFTTGFMLFCLLTLRFRRRTLSTLGVAIGLTASATLISVLLYRDSMATMIGRTSDLTGRTYIWALVSESISRHPLLGHGFGGYWQSTYDSFRINDLLGWTVPSSHNVYLDITLQLGFLGIGLFVLAFATSLLRAIRTIRNRSETEARWPLVYLMMAAAYGFSESDLFSANSLYWVLFTAACITATQYAPVEASPQATLQNAPSAMAAVHP